jgi:hypothetical protein
VARRRQQITSALRSTRIGGKPVSYADWQSGKLLRTMLHPPGAKPWVQPPPPTGSFDPALDAQRRAATRGLGDTVADIGTANTRDTVDYGLNRDDILRAQTRGLADLTTSRDRGYGDVDRQVSVLHRGFQTLAGQQRQQFQAHGLGYGGAALQAAAKRQANEAFDRQPLDVARRRIGEDFTRGSGRLNEDTGLQLGRLALDYAPPDATNPLGGRRFQDRATQLTRAQREDTAFGLDTGAEKIFQATQSGWVPPEPPKKPRGVRPRFPQGTRGRPGRRPNTNVGSGRLY